MTIIEESTTTDRWVIDDTDLYVPHENPLINARQVLNLIGTDTSSAVLNHDRRLRIESLLRQVEETRQAIEQARRDHESWLVRLTEVAHTVANNHDWCERFDEGMDRVGLATRNQEVTVTATLVYEVDIDVDDMKTAIVLQATGTTDPACDEIELEGAVGATFTVNVSRDFTVPRGSCACSNYDRYTILEDTPVWIDDKDFTISTVDCSNCG